MDLLGDTPYAVSPDAKSKSAEGEAASGLIDRHRHGNPRGPKSRYSRCRVSSERMQTLFETPIRRSAGSGRA